MNANRTMKSLKILLYTLLGCAISVSQCARILGVFHVNSFSHFVLGETLLKELAKKGHNVTMVSCFPQKTPVENYRDIPLVKAAKIVKETGLFRNGFGRLSTPVPLFLLMLGEIGLKLTEAVFEENSMQSLLNSDEQFDVVLVEEFVSDALKGLAYRFNAPLIVTSTIGSTVWINHLVGNTNSIAYAPNVFLSYSSHMTFYQRMMNSLIDAYANIYYNLYFFNEQNKILQKYIPIAPHIHNIMYNTSLILLNSHSSFSSVKPYMPSMIEIGGFHVKEAQELPAELKEFMDNSEEGVIYFSLGGNLKSRDMSKENINAIIKAIGRLKIKVLWKFEEENLSNKSDNLKIGKWFPQQSILAHPNIKLFITHGGLLSIIESVHYGVPILGIPIFGDQQMNMAEVVERGFGLTLQYNDITEDNLYSAIKQIISNPKYMENAKLRSRVFRDRPTKPLDLAIYWIEYVTRHKGASHFRSAALDLNWFQYLLLDVVLFLTVATTALIIGFYYLLKFIVRKNRNMKKEKHQ